MLHTPSTLQKTLYLLCVHGPHADSAILSSRSEDVPSIMWAGHLSHLERGCVWERSVSMLDRHMAHHQLTSPGCAL